MPRVAKPRSKQAKPAGVVPAAPRTYRKHFTERELQEMVQIARERGTRDATLLAVMYDCGLRASEVGALTLEHASRLHEDPPFLYVSRAKGSKSSWWRVATTTRQLLLAWIDDLYPERAAREKALPLFPGNMRYKGARRALSRHAVFRFINGLALEAGVPANVAHPHALRHARAQHLLEAADVESRKRGSVFPVETVMPALTAMLGHAAKATVAHYISTTRGAMALMDRVTENALGGLLEADDDEDEN